MNLTKIRYFVEVARCGNFSEAARRLYTAQPNVSKQIAQMEQELDFSLFVRSKRAVKLTPAGQLLYDRLKDLPDELEQLFDQAPAAIPPGGSAAEYRHPGGAGGQRDIADPIESGPGAVSQP